MNRRSLASTCETSRVFLITASDLSSTLSGSSVLGNGICPEEFLLECFQFFDALRNVNVVEMFVETKVYNSLGRRLNKNISIPVNQALYYRRARSLHHNNAPLEYLVGGEKLAFSARDVSSQGHCV